MHAIGIDFDRLGKEKKCTYIYTIHIRKKLTTTNKSSFSYLQYFWRGFSSSSTPRPSSQSPFQTTTRTTTSSFLSFFSQRRARQTNSFLGSFLHPIYGVSISVYVWQKCTYFIHRYIRDDTMHLMGEEIRIKALEWDTKKTPGTRRRFKKGMCPRFLLVLAAF